jgi:hypothetical protein
LEKGSKDKEVKRGKKNGKRTNSLRGMKRRIVNGPEWFVFVLCSLVTQFVFCVDVFDLYRDHTGAVYVMVDSPFGPIEMYDSFV